LGGDILRAGNGLDIASQDASVLGSCRRASSARGNIAGMQDNFMTLVNDMSLSTTVCSLACCTETGRRCRSAADAAVLDALMIWNLNIT
jgi:hypothetical protein